MLKRFDTIWFEVESNKDNKKLFDSLDNCFLNKNCKDAVNILFESDKGGCKISASFIGNFYMNGKHGLKKDIDKAIYWHTKAFFENKDIDAGLDIAILYNNLAIKNKDNVFYKKSIKVYEKIATVNNHIALNMLGKYYEQGLGVDKNIDKALEYYQQAVKAGNLVAAVAVGRIHCLHKDFLTGLKMCLKAKFKLLYKTFKNPNSESLRRQ